MARDQRRQLASSQIFNPNSLISFDLPVTSVLSEINLALEYAASTNGTGTLQTPFDRAPWTLIKRIDLIADGRDTIKSYDGGTLLDINHWDYGEYPPSQITNLGVSLANGTPAYPLQHMLTINLKAPGMNPEFNPKTGMFEGGENLTLLDTRKFNSLELRITFGAFGGTGSNDVFTTSAATATLDLLRLTPWGKEILDLSRDSAFAINQEIMTVTAFPTTTAVDRAFKLNVGNPYRRVMFSTVDSNSRAAVNRINSIKLLENGSFYRRIQTAALIANRNALHAPGGGLAVGLDPANPSPLVRAIPAMNPPVETTQGQNAGNRRGFYVLEIAEDNRVTSLLDTRGFSALEAVLSWDGANNTDLLRIISNTIVPNIR
jgi:hypothetical protein